MENHEYIDEHEYISVICQFTKDGNVIPIKIQLYNDEGDLQSYLIKGYRSVEQKPGDNNLNIHRFEARIIVFNQSKLIKLIFIGKQNRWYIEY